jgi:hypothetical protein
MERVYPPCFTFSGLAAESLGLCQRHRPDLTAIGVAVGRAPFCRLLGAASLSPLAGRTLPQFPNHVWTGLLIIGFPVIVAVQGCNFESNVTRQRLKLLLME